MGSIKRILSYILTIIIFFIFVTGVFASSKNFGNLSNNLKSTIYEINDFNDFQILREENDIISDKNSTVIEFEYTGNSSTFYLMKYYYLNLDDYGNCSDFEVEIYLTYNITGSISFGKFETILGSYYNESGEYSGIPDCTLIGYPQDPAFVICKDNFVDAWSESGSEFRVFAYPNDIYDYYSSERGIYGSTGSAIFILERENNELYCQVKKGGITQIDHTWYSNVTKPLNFIMIGCGIYGNEADYAKAIFTDFSASFEFLTTIKLGYNFTSIILPSLTFVAILVIILKKFKK